MILRGIYHEICQKHKQLVLGCCHCCCFCLFCCCCNCSCYYPTIYSAVSYSYCDLNMRQCLNDNFHLLPKTSRKYRIQNLREGIQEETTKTPKNFDFQYTLTNKSDLMKIKPKAKYIPCQYDKFKFAT